MTRTLTVEELRDELAIWRKDGLQLRQQLEEALEVAKFANCQRLPSLDPSTHSGQIYRILADGPLRLGEIIVKAGLTRNTAHKLVREMTGARQIVRVKFGVYGLPGRETEIAQ